MKISSKSANLLLQSLPNPKMKGGGLLYTLLILLVLGVIMGIFLLRFRLHSELIQQLEAKMRASENAISAVNYFLAVDSDKQGKVKGTLFGTKADSFWVQTEEWGVYRLLYVKARHGKMEAEKICLVGMQPTENLQSAIFLTDNHQPLKIVGKTKIVGDAYLPQSGLQMGNIGNRTYESDSLIWGKVKKSKSEKLNISYRNLERYFTQLSKLSETSSSQITNSGFPFQIQTNIYKGSGIINKQLSPFSCIISTESLEIVGNTDADLCVFYAPSVHIRSGFSGSIQVFATDSIVIEENVRLFYPSALVLSATSLSSKGLIKIKRNTQIEGCVINDASILQQISNNDNYTLLDKNALLKGQLISNGKIELKGNVKGLVAANTFQLSTPSAVYINHLLDTEIDYRHLSPSFTTGTFVANNPNYRVICWLK